MITKFLAHVYKTSRLYFSLFHNSTLLKIPLLISIMSLSSHGQIIYIFCCLNTQLSPRASASGRRGGRTRVGPGVAKRASHLWRWALNTQIMCATASAFQIFNRIAAAGRFTSIWNQMTDCLGRYSLNVTASYQPDTLIINDQWLIKKYVW